MVCCGSFGGADGRGKENGVGLMGFNGDDEKHMGGLGFHDMELVNLALLVSRLGAS